MIRKSFGQAPEIVKARLPPLANCEHCALCAKPLQVTNALQRLTLPARSLDPRAAMENCFQEGLHHSLESCSFSAVSLSSSSHISSSERVFFFLPSFSFFSRS